MGLGTIPTSAQPGCDCAEGEENICDLGDCGDATVCCRLILVPVNQGLLYLTIAGGLFMLMSVFYARKSNSDKSLYSVLQNSSRKIPRFF